MPGIPLNFAIGAPASGGFSQGWHTLPVGGGGLTTGLDIAPDGTVVVRTDEYGAYRWSGTTATFTTPSDTWVQLTNPAQDFGASCYECVIAHSQTSRIAFISANDNGSGRAYAIYISNDSGSTWTNSGLSFDNADGNGPQKNASGKICFDPNQADVVYAGMPTSSSISGGLYRSIDGGVSFSAVSGISAPTINFGTCAITFDKAFGTTTVGGQLRTKRMMCVVGGVGIYETVDGGVNFSEVGNSPIGTCTANTGQIDFSGVWYINNNGNLWRYSGASGTWINLFAQAGWGQGTGWLSSGGLVVVDPRTGHQGTVSATGPQGMGAGFTSTNATASGASITWGGYTGGGTPLIDCPSYDVPWQNHGLGGFLNAFLFATNAIIDSNGDCYWTGNQGAIWKINNGPLNYAGGPSGAPNQTTYSRGTEMVVSTCVCKPPGSVNTIRGMQDTGAMKACLANAYPTDYYVTTQRMDAYNIDYCRVDTTFLVARVEVEFGTDYSAFSTDQGITWTPYATMPDTMYTGGGLPTTGGQILALTHDKHVVCPQGTGGPYQPIYTTNATNNSSVTWNFCTGLPAFNWFHGAFVAPTLSKPFAYDFVTAGTCYAVAPDNSIPSLVYRSTDFGANWTNVGSQQISAGGNYIGITMLATPGYAGHLWMAPQSTSAGGNALWHSEDGGATWITLPPPTAFRVPWFMDIGAPVTPGGYPTVWFAGTAGGGNPDVYFYGTWNVGSQTMTWTQLTGTANPATNTNLPRSMARNFLLLMKADPDVFGRLFFGTSGSGFCYYQP